MNRSITISIADQALLSLFNLALNACLVAYASPTEFGRYVFAATLLLFATSVQNALVITPISVVYPAKAAADRPAWRESILAVDRLFRLVAAGTTGLLATMTDHDPGFLAATAALVLASLARETQRALALAEARVADLIRIDAIAVAVSIAATVALWGVVRPATAALAGAAIGSITAVWLTSMRGRTEPGDGHAVLDFDQLTTYYRPIWRHMRWALVGASTTEVQNRAYVVMLEVFRTSRDIAEVQAGRLLMGPLPLLAGAWARVARPHLAQLLAAGETRKALIVTVRGVVGMALAAAVFAVVLTFAWPLLEARIFRGRYPQVAELTALWTAYTVLTTLHIALSAPLIAALRLQALSRVTMLTAALALVLLLGLIAPVPLRYVVGVAIGCELIALMWISILVHRLFRDLSAKPRPAALPPAAGRTVAAAGARDP